MRLLALCSALLMASTLAAEVEVMNLRGSVLAVRMPVTSPESIVLQRQLSSIPMTMEVADAPLPEVMDLFRQTTGVNVVLHPALHADAPIVTLSVRDMTASKTLGWIRRLAGVDVHFMDGAVFLIREPVQRDEQLVLYDVTDLTHPIPNFAGPQIGLGNEPGGNLNWLPAEEPDHETRWDIEELAEIIEDHLGDQAER